MVLAIGTKTPSNANPNGLSQTLAHNNDGDLLLVVITMPNTATFTGATYGGEAMTLKNAVTFSNLSQIQASYYILDPEGGTNNIVISFSGSQFNSTSIFAVSFSGASGLGNTAIAGDQATPNIQDITIEKNSIIYTTGVSINSQSTQYTIAGSSRPFEFSHNSNKIVRGCLSQTGLDAGVVEVSIGADFGNITHHSIEIREQVQSTGNFLLLF